MAHRTTWLRSDFDYLVSLGGEAKEQTERLLCELSDGKITEDEYFRTIYSLYFKNYYPDITAYETSSDVPLLRNYYYHSYIKEGYDKYLFIFDDYLTGSFETDGGIRLSFYGFFGDLDDGVVVADGDSAAEASGAVDRFIKQAYGATTSMSLYAYAMNIFSLIPFIALMPMVVTLLAYSILKLRGVESIKTLGGTFKIIGSYVWFSGVISAVLSVVFSFFVQRNLITALPLVFFFIALAVRSIIFAVNEAKLSKKNSEQLRAVHTED